MFIAACVGAYMVYKETGDPTEINRCWKTAKVAFLTSLALMLLINLLAD